MQASSPSAAPALRIDLDRLKDDLHNLAQIGLNERDHGLYRMAFTEAEMEAKAWLEERLAAHQLPTRRDGAANVWARLEGRNPGPAIVIGSHLDTVPCAGTLDGSLGVLVGLECLRTLRDSGIELDRTIELVAFSDEEGRFGGMLGSQAVVGEVSPERLHARDLDGVTLAEAMQSCGLDPRGVLEAARPASEVYRYLELHIEQGPVLAREGVPVGIVDEITGLFRWAVTFRGESNHAGTTPMHLRRDAFMGLADFAHEIPRILEENGTDRSRATIGKIQIVPGAPNTVPGQVEFSLDVRDTRPEILEELATACRKVLSAIGRRRQLMFDFEELSRIAPVRCDPELVEVLEATAAELPLSALRLPSGAAHDAQMMARLTPVAMLFVPSRDGISHSPAEWTAMKDIEAGANLTLQALIRLASSSTE